MMRFFCAGETRAKTVACSAAPSSAARPLSTSYAVQQAKTPSGAPPAAVFDDNGEAPALEVEGDLVNLPVSVDDPAALENRLVQRTLDAGLMGAVDEGEGQRP